MSPRSWRLIDIADHDARHAAVLATRKDADVLALYPSWSMVGIR